MSNDLLDPWGPTSSGSDLLDPWDAAVQQQAHSILPTAALPSTPLPSEAPIPLVAADLNPLPRSSAVTHVASTTTVKETPASTYWILGGLLGALGIAAWWYFRKDMSAEPEGGVDGLGDLDALKTIASYALPVSEKHYFLVEEIGKSGKRVKVQFPESGAVISVDPEDLLSEKEARQQGLEER